MGKVPKPKVPKMIKINDPRIRDSYTANLNITNKKKLKRIKAANKRAKPIETKAQVSSTTMFFNYNQQLGPPYLILCDTNFINFSIKNKLDIEQGLMDCLLAKCVPYVTDCVIAELQKLGSKYRVALKMIKQSFQRLPCMHKGTYADDCIVNRVNQHKCYIVGTCDKDLKNRLRKIPGVPLVSIKTRQYCIERMPDDYGCTRK